jgi:hypothetical protein
MVLIGGLLYAGFSVALESPRGCRTHRRRSCWWCPPPSYVVLLQRIGLSRAVAVSAFVIFLYRAVPAWARAIATGPSIT